MKKNTKLLFNSFLVTLLLFITQVFAQGNEDFTNLPSDPGAASSYLNRSWLGTDNVTWTGNGRKDRNINGAGNPAICMGGTNQSAAGYILSPTYSGGIGTLTFTTVRDFTSTNPRTLRILVNGVQQGADFSVSATSDTPVTYSEIINIPGNVVLEIRSVGANQVKVDDISWTSYTPSSPFISAITSSLSEFIYVEGNGPSSIQNFQVSGANLVPASGNILVTAPSSYEVSLDGVNFSSSQNIAYTGGTFTSEIVYVRLISGLTASTYNENIILSGGSATDVSVSLTGKVVPPFQIPYFNPYTQQSDYDDSILQGLNYSAGMIFTTAAGGYLNIGLNEYLETPIIDFSLYTDLLIGFDMRNFGGDTGQEVSVLISNDGGVTFSTLNTYTMNGGYSPYLTLIDLSSNNSINGKIRIEMTAGTNSARVRNLSIETPVVWNGTSWSNVVGPNINLKAIINGNFSTSANGVFDAESLQVINGTMTINSNDLITVENEIDEVSPGQLVIESDAYVIQNTDAVNNGFPEVQRLSTPMIRLDYTAWSSPVGNTNLLNFSPNTLPNRFYTYNPAGVDTATSWISVADPSTTSFSVGTGYLIRVDNTWSSSVSSPYLGRFYGRLNNGPYNTSVGIGYNLIGNPYPSPIDADVFLADNSGIGATTMYFWTHTIPSSGGTYAQNNYASYTTAGGVAAAAGGAQPDGTIQVGQGFFINATSAGNAQFNNAQRVGSSSGQFFKNTSVERHRYWLNLSSDSNASNQMMVAYMTGATNGIDAGIDGKLFTNSLNSIASFVNNESYVIQGRSLSFDVNDEVPLIFKADTNSSYTISLDHFDGFFENQDIFIWDKQQNVIHDLKASAYNFSSLAGEYSNRFSVVYKNSALSENDFQPLQVLVYTSNNTILINADKTNINQVMVYDMQGRKLVSKEIINSTEATIENTWQTNQVLIVEVFTENGRIVKKIIL